MISTHITAKADLNRDIGKTYMKALFATGDSRAHTISVEVMRDGQAVSLSGAAVSAYFIRACDNATITLTGSASGNTVSVTLTQTCYRKSGAFALIIKAAVGGVVSTVFYGEGSMYASTTDTIVDEEHVLPSLEDLLAQIAVMEAATASANTAAGRAETAAENIENLTVSAKSGTTAAAAVSDTGNGYKISFTLPKGEKGDKGDPGANGTGSGTVTAVNGVKPNDTGNVTLTAEDVGALAADAAAANAEKLGGAAANEYMMRKSAQRPTYTEGGEGDADALTDSFATVRISASENAALYAALGSRGSMAYVLSFNYATLSAIGNRFQIACAHAQTSSYKPAMAYRVYNSGWSAWRTLVCADDLESAYASGVNEA